MDTNGKIIWAKHSEIQQANLKAMGDAEIKDGERLPLAVKDMGSCEIYPQTIQHNPNGRYASSVWALSLIIASPQDYADISTTNTCIQFTTEFTKRSLICAFLCYQVCCGLRRWGVYNLHCNGFEEQELWISTGVCVGT